MNDQMGIVGYTVCWCLAFWLGFLPACVIPLLIVVGPIGRAVDQGCAWVWERLRWALRS
jgi:hypothetical protein